MSAWDARSVEEALESLDFERARALAGRAEGPERERLLERVAASRTEATRRAEQLAARIQSLARADHYEGLLALAADPATEPQLRLVSAELRRGADLHLDGALRRQKRFRSAAERHMKAAAEALVLFDTTRALSELGRVEARWLTESQRDELEKLRNQTEMAAAERMELESRTAKVLREHQPAPAAEPASRASGRRGARIPRPGCLGSLLLTIPSMAGLAVLLAS